MKNKDLSITASQKDLIDHMPPAGPSLASPISPKSPKTLMKAKSTVQVHKAKEPSITELKVNKHTHVGEGVVTDLFGSKLKLNSSPEGKEKRNTKWQQEQEHREYKAEKMKEFQEIKASSLSRSVKKAYSLVEPSDMEQVVWFMETDLEEKKKVRDLVKRLTEDKKLKEKRKALAEDRKKLYDDATVEGEDQIRKEHSKSIINMGAKDMAKERKKWGEYAARRTDRSAQIEELKTLLSSQADTDRTPLKKGKSVKKLVKSVVGTGSKKDQDIQEQRDALHLLERKQHFGDVVAAILNAQGAVTEADEACYYAERALEDVPYVVLRNEEFAAQMVLANKGSAGSSKDWGSVDHSWSGYHASVTSLRESDGVIGEDVIASIFPGADDDDSMPKLESRKSRGLSGLFKRKSSKRDSAGLGNVEEA